MQTLAKRLRTLSEKATAGPWGLRHQLASAGMDRNGYARQVVIGDRGITVDFQTHINGTFRETPIGCGYVRYERKETFPFVAEESADAALIVELRNHLPEIISALEAEAT